MWAEKLTPFQQPLRAKGLCEHSSACLHNRHDGSYSGFRQGLMLATTRLLLQRLAIFAAGRAAAFELCQISGCWSSSAAPGGAFTLAEGTAALQEGNTSGVSRIRTGLKGCAGNQVGLPTRCLPDIGLLLRDVLSGARSLRENFLQLVFA